MERNTIPARRYENHHEHLLTLRANGGGMLYSLVVYLCTGVRILSADPLAAYIELASQEVSPIPIPRHHHI